jgi:hypothetical protein
LFKGEKSTRGSSATWRRESPLVNAIRATFLRIHPSCLCAWFISFTVRVMIKGGVKTVTGQLVFGQEVNMRFAREDIAGTQEAGYFSAIALAFSDCFGKGLLRND